MQRRTWIAACAGLACTGAWAQLASGTMRIVTPTPVGVGTDTFARLYAELLAKSLNTTVIVENRPGASGMLGADSVAKAQPNGSTLLLSTSLPLTTAPHLFAKVPYNAQKDFVPVAELYGGGSFLVAGAGFKAHTLAELVALARRQPGAITYAAYGTGGTAHVGMERLQDAAGIRLLQVPYKQSALNDVISGQVDLGFEPPASALPHIRSGRLTALAYTGDKRSAALPEVPTLAEAYPGLVIRSWVGVWVPAGTPEAVVQRLHAAFMKANADPQLLRTMADVGALPLEASREQMRTDVEQESKEMRELITAKNIRIE